jgi:hypothetical protein
MACTTCGGGPKPSIKYELTLNDGTKQIFDTRSSAESARPPHGGKIRTVVVTP